MKILYVSLENVSLQKGSVTHIQEIIEELRLRGHFVTLVACASNLSEKIEHFYNLYKKPKPSLKWFGLSNQSLFLSSIFLFLYLMKNLSRYDLVYSREYYTVIIAAFPRILYKKKIIFEANGLANEEEKLKSFSCFNRIMAFLIFKAEWLAIHLSDQIISVTPEIKSYFIRHFACPENKVKVVSNGVNTKKFFPMSNPLLLSQWRRKFGIGSEELLVIFVGNLARWQGVDILIDSGIHLMEKIENLRLIIVGDGSMKDSLVKKISASPVREKFIFTGMVQYSDIPFLINMADLGVAPFIRKRNFESGVSPLKVYEYLACGIPVVTSRISGLEFIETEELGKLVEPGDLRGLVEAQFELLRDSRKRVAMGQKGAKIVKEKYSWSKKVDEIERLLFEIVSL